MKAAVVSIILCGLSFCTGCGLVVVPTVRVFPGPVKSIRIVDSDTREPVLHAMAEVAISRAENWFVAPPMLQRDRSGQAGSWEELLKKNDGSFAMRPTSALGWARIWLPLPPVLGPALLDEPYAHVRIYAPGYENVVYVYSPVSPPEPGRRVLKADREYPGDAVFDEDGTLTIHLVRKTPSDE